MERYITNPQVIHETIEGETIIIDLATGTYFSLLGAGPTIWEGLVVGETDADLVARAGNAFEANEDEIASAVEVFLAELEREQLIARSNGAQPAAAPAPASEPAATKTPFEAPRLERYTDMQDIILLDPVHQVDAAGWPHTPEAREAG